MFKTKLYNEINQNNIFEIVKDKFESVLEIKLSDFGASK